jgi:hypothetical protein
MHGRTRSPPWMIRRTVDGPQSIASIVRIWRPGVSPLTAVVTGICKDLNNGDDDLVPAAASRLAYSASLGHVHELLGFKCLSPPSRGPKAQVM